MPVAERSTVEIVLFAALIAASVSLFLLRLMRVARIVSRSKPDSDFSWTPIAPRLRRLVWEVALQAKVIAARPLVGLAHAAVFWGFCVFALVTLDHIARGFNLRVLGNGFWSWIYFSIASVFSIFVRIAIAALAIRRFVFRPKWLGEKLSLGSAAIAVLIFALMVTYALDYRHDFDPTRRTVWWLHSIALFALLPLIPHTKHLHLLLAPVSIYASRGRFAAIPPLVGDEDFGLLTGKDVTRITALQTHACVECGRCQEHCPAHTTGKLLNPKQIALGFRAYLQEHGAMSDAPLEGVHLSREAAFQCTTCGACESICPVGVEHLPLIVGLRRAAVNTGEWEDARGAELFNKLERTGNPLGFSSTERDRFIERAALPIYDGTQDYVLWLGCMGSYDASARETIVAVAELMRYLNVSFGVLRKEKCSGDAARRLGNDLLFQQLAEFNMAQLDAVKATKIVSICPHCVQTMAQDWREFGARYEVVHHTELLARYAGQLPRSQDASNKIVFHDPCYLSRYRHSCDAPRQLVQLGGTTVEAKRSHERSFCCGAGGGLTFLGEEQGTRIGAVRAQELTATGASTVATACPFCASMLGDALAQTPSVARVDVAQIALERVRASARD